MNLVTKCLVILSVLVLGILANPDLGKWDFNLSKEDNYVGVVKNAYNGSRLDIRIGCNSTPGPLNVTVGYVLRRTVCWEEYFSLDSLEAQSQQLYKQYYDKPYSLLFVEALPPDYKPDYIKHEFTTACSEVITIHPHLESMVVPAPQVGQTFEPLPQPEGHVSSFVSSSTADLNNVAQESFVSPTPPAVRSKRQADTTNTPVYRLEKEGVYLLVVRVSSTLPTQPITASVHVEIKAESGFLSITDWPLLPFYATMCGVYVLLGLAWLLVCAMHWRDILRVQFWIGGVIFLGMLEKAMFTSEYQNINNSGQATAGLIIAAELVSSAKRTLARMLVIIVSLGFGIVKPRLGPTLHRVVGTGGLYFILASVESVLRVIHPKNDLSNKTLLAAVPLAVVDASICWWVFSALIQTTRTLRLRRNLVKLSLYKHFTNTLVFNVVASVVFMLWSIKYHKVVDCLTEWQDLWVDEAFWHLLFSVLLCVIMVLWRPSQNNQRYAFTPLLDNEEDDISSEEEILYNGEAWGGEVKMRGAKSPRPDTPEGADPEEDPLKWVEENIPDIEGALPVIDSEEEIETTKVEISKLM